jgi:hypothetical protein
MTSLASRGPGVALRRSAALRLLTAALLAVAPLASCGGGSPSDPGVGAPASISRSAGHDQQAPIASRTPVEPAVVVRDGTGQPVPGAAVTFSVTGGGGWVSSPTVTTDAAGRAATAWYMGPRPGTGQTLAASTGNLSVDFAATSISVVPGRSYFGASEYVELIPGELPIIISAPHGGSLRPAEIPDRTGSNVTTVQDANTEQLAREIGKEFRARTGRAPTLVIVRLHRVKLDANRELGEAALGNAHAGRAWHEYHGYIEAARAAIVAAGREGVYIDLHGHGHDIQRLELGYRLTATDLAQSDAVLSGAALVQKSSLRARVAASGLPHADLIRGGGGLGTLFEARGFPTVPSAAQPSPGAAPYFTGGYNTDRHASRDGNLISGLQIEANREGVRDTEANRRRFAAVLLEVLQQWHPALFDAPGATGDRAPIRLPTRQRSRIAR